ncbi:HAD family hydrolase [Rhizobium sp. NFR03]|uniref:HAD family hydrolase n=1 Tax=Rhizobium sp. NFR03 TaxID=1566263 RepID=UPI0008BF3873|nr:HAD family hydrolase [Rhizobium sp. NFR03]SES06198.1 putative hydrolase of the HAD superfamily [Rhizobium sp. NFR03]
MTTAVNPPAREAGRLLVGFDADDTLWQNEQFYRLTEDAFAASLADYCEATDLSERLLAAERRNLALYGFGIKGFTLSMIETALELTNSELPGHIVGRILEIGREMLRHPVDLLPSARETLEALAGRHRLVLITKGDLFDQERKLAASGLGPFFDGIEIVSDKTELTYQNIFARHGIEPDRCVMIGNSLKSDILPVLGAGASAIFIPHDLTWIHEHAEKPEGDPRFFEVADLSAVPGILQAIA